MTTAEGEHSGRILKKILQPVAEQIAQLRLDTNGIVFVIHRPGKVARAAMRKIGVVDLHVRGTTVFGLRCDDAVAAVGHDPVTRRWVGEQPIEDEIKVFLVAGESTALLTLQFRDGQIAVKKEPDLYPVG